MSLNDTEIENRTCTVVEDWTATYPDPIKVVEGEPIELTGRRDVWDGYTWLWARNGNGKEGWIPDCIVSTTNPVMATETYSAMELTCHKGETLVVKRYLHGWAYCGNGAGRKGWVPRRHIRISDHLTCR